MQRAFTSILLIFLIGFAPGLSFAQKTKKNSPPKEFSPTIEWDEPDLVPNSGGKKSQVVILSGLTEPGIRVVLGKEIVWLKNVNVPSDFKKISTKKLFLKDTPAIVNEKDGHFTITLKLPEGDVQIPVGFVRGNKKAKFQLTLSVQKNVVVIKEKIDTPADCNYCVWFGAGASYLGYKQDPPQNIQAVDYGAIAFPSISLRGQYKLNKKWKLRATYHNISGPKLSAADINLDNSNIAWTYLSLEGDYRAFRGFRLFGIRFDPVLLVGIQSHDMPFLVSKTDTDFTIEHFKFLSGSVGGLFFINAREKWYYEVFMRFQLALTGQSDVKLKSGFAFDGSVGAIRRLSERWRLGFFWGGQYHNYNYTVDSAKGSYSLLSSKVESNIGYEF